MSKLRMRKLWLVLAAAILVSLSSGTNAADLSVKVADKPPQNQISESIRKTLQPKAVQVLDGETPLFEFWFSAEVPLKSKPASIDKALDALRETTLLGAAIVGKGQRHYKDNEIPAGVYTLRFALHPQC